MILDVLVALAGATVVLLTTLSAIVTVVVPRGVPVRLTRAVFRLSRRAFEVRSTLLRHDYERRDRAMSRYAPFTLVGLAFVWLGCVLVGFIAIFHSIADVDWAGAFETSGSSMLTLGTAELHGVGQHIAAFAEAGLGLLLLALLITYLPTMYASFSRREALVTRTSISAGTPPAAWDLIERYFKIAGFDRLEQHVWVPWTAGFVDLEESHTSLGALALFRSPDAHRSWVTASGTVLDTAAIMQSSVEGYDSSAAQLTIRAGFLALTAIAEYFGLDHDRDPAADAPISIAREELDDVLDRLASIGVPITADREQAWNDFRGWRVNYDRALLNLANYTFAPFAPWTGDRSPPLRHTLETRHRRRPLAS